MDGDTKASVASDAQITNVGAVDKIFPRPDWASAKGLFPDWLWSGLVSEEASMKKERVDCVPSADGMDTAALDHARGA